MSDALCLLAETASDSPSPSVGADAAPHRKPRKSSTQKARAASEQTQFIYDTLVAAAKAGKGFATAKNIHKAVRDASVARFGKELTNKQISNALTYLPTKAAAAGANDSEHEARVGEYEGALETYRTAIQERDARVAGARTRHQRQQEAAAGPPQPVAPVKRVLSVATANAVTANAALALVLESGQKQVADKRKAAADGKENTGKRKKRRGQSTGVTQSVDLVEEPDTPPVVAASPTQVPAYKKTAFSTSTVVLQLAEGLQRQNERFGRLMDRCDGAFEAHASHMAKVEIFNQSMLYLRRVELFGEQRATEIEAAITSSVAAAPTVDNPSATV